MDLKAVRASELKLESRNLLCDVVCCRCKAHLGQKECNVPSGHPAVTSGLCTPCSTAILGELTECHSKPS